jgi:hypothetical protein
MFRKHPSHQDGSGGHIRIDRTAARPVVQSPTATNARKEEAWAHIGLLSHGYYYYYYYYILYQNQQMHISVRNYIIHTVYLLYVSATHVAIFSEVHYKG